MGLRVRVGQVYFPHDVHIYMRMADPEYIQASFHRDAAGGVRGAWGLTLHARGAACLSVRNARYAQQKKNRGRTFAARWARRFGQESGEAEGMQDSGE